KICMIIDGLDELEEPQESLWRLCSQVNSWTSQAGSSSHNDHLKLLISSREELPIIKAFPSANILILHTLTEPDIKALVETTLESNQFYQALVGKPQSFERQSQELQDLIVMHAEGVFLWVVLLLKWMEEELATGTSFQALQNVVHEAPVELDDFFEKILGAIARQHQPGAWFVFAMLM
ncbi:hypothetical protein M011DRAFT_372120, partial [Sporormia fimetaria CBS 119925]